MNLEKCRKRTAAMFVKIRKLHGSSKLFYQRITVLVLLVHILIKYNEHFKPEVTLNSLLDLKLRKC